MVFGDSALRLLGSSKVPIICNTNLSQKEETHQSIPTRAPTKASFRSSMIICQKVRGSQSECLISKSLERMQLQVGRRAAVPVSKMKLYVGVLSIIDAADRIKFR